ncbi:MAG: HDOD domain-containing protein [Myxococcales bacterium]|nr:HDOD domain-containing protein [Myxococcales bacterium]
MSNLLEQLRKASSIPSPPGVALEILNLNQGDDIDIDELAEVVTRDPAIVAKLLRMANSANFGRPGQVSDIRQAIMTLGLRSVNLLALSFSLASYSKGEGGGRFDYQRYWTSTAVITTASSILAKEHLSRFKDEVFLASILCDFGQLILAEAATKKYRPVLQRKAKSSAPLHEIEREILDTDHAEIGSELLGEWGLPTLICNAVQHHHAPHKA